MTGANKVKNILHSSRFIRLIEIRNAIQEIIERRKKLGLGTSNRTTMFQFGIQISLMVTIVTKMFRTTTLNVVEVVEEAEAEAEAVVLTTIETVLEDLQTQEAIKILVTIVE